MLDDATILRFLRAVDDALSHVAPPGQALELFLLGSASLILSFRLRAITKDVDVVHIEGSPLLEKANQLFGKGSANANAWGFYLESVPSGLPPLPNGFQSRARAIPGDWVVLRPRILELHDLAVSKLSRFHAKDREDLQRLCDTGEISVETLGARLDQAFLFSEEGDPKRERAYAHVRRVIDYLEGRITTL